MLAYDTSGHGLSQGGARSITEFAADLATLMEALEVEAALICGVSVGGMIAQALAAARPDLVAGLVLCNTGVRIGTAESWAARIGTLEAGGLEPMADEIMRRWFSDRFRRDEPALAGGCRMMLTRTPLAGYRAVCAAIRDADLTGGAGQLICPTLCISGSDDLATPPGVVEAMAALIPGARTICYDGGGHLPCVETPARLAGDIIGHMEHLR